MKEQWLRCHLLKGMFSDEVAIKFSSLGTPVSFFVSKEYVNGEVDREGKVRVNTFTDAGTVWAVLPTPQKKIVAVDAGDLVAVS